VSDHVVRRRDHGTGLRQLALGGNGPRLGYGKGGAQNSDL